MAKAAPAEALATAVVERPAPPELAVIVPTLNERDNVEPLLAQLAVALDGLEWEAVFVDDDSQDGTWALLEDLQRRLPHVRALRRIGRRGLASACIEGMLATSAPYLAVIDADLQHDETILPRMLATLKARRLDLVVGTRFAPHGSVGELSRGRLLISRLGRLLSRAISRADLSDPMSGYFVVHRDFLDETVRRVSAQGFKILLDLFASSPRRVRFAEVPYRFRQRQHGQSKLDAPVLLEYVTLIGDKLLGRYVPVRFVAFVLVGLFGLVIHLAILGLCFRIFEIQFYYSQVIATLMAMTTNFNLNNVFTIATAACTASRCCGDICHFISFAASGRSPTFRSPSCCSTSKCPGRWPAPLALSWVRSGISASAPPSRGESATGPTAPGVSTQKWRIHGMNADGRSGNAAGCSA